MHQTALVLRTFILGFLLTQLLACSDEPKSASTSVVVDSAANLTVDTAAHQILATDSTSDEEDGEPDDVHDYQTDGTYLGSDPTKKLVIEGVHFKFFVGNSLKLKGEISFAGPSEDSTCIALNPFGRNQLIVLPTYWSSFDEALGFDWDGVHFERQATTNQ